MGWLLNLLSLPKSHVGVPSIPVTDGCVSNLVLKTVPDNRDSATSLGKGINMFLWKNFSDHQTPFFEASLKFGVTLPVNIWHKDQIIPFLLAAALSSASFPGVCRLTRYKAPATLQELTVRAPCPYCPAPNTLPCSWLRRGAQQGAKGREGASWICQELLSLTHLCEVWVLCLPQPSDIVDHISP